MNPHGLKLQQNSDLSLLKKHFWETVLENEMEDQCQGWEVVNEWTANDLSLGLKQMEKVLHEYKSKIKTATLVVL